MANTPKRPPNRDSGGGPPRGPRSMALARNRKDAAFRKQVEAAADRLREVGSPDHAATIDALLAPNGWVRLRRAKAADPESSTLEPTRSIRMTPVERTHLNAAAQGVGDDLVALGNHLLSEFVWGRFLPDRPVPSPYGSGTKKVSMSLRLDSSLWDLAEAHGKELQAELGWCPSPSAVVRAGLLLKFPLPATTAAE